MFSTINTTNPTTNNPTTNNPTNTNNNEMAKVQIKPAYLFGNKSVLVDRKKSIFTQTDSKEVNSIFTQTDQFVKFYGTSFVGNKDILKKKALAICLLTCFKTNLTKVTSLDKFSLPNGTREIEEIEAILKDNGSVPLTSTNLGLYGLINLSETDISQKIGNSDSTRNVVLYTYFKLIKILIEETITNVDDLYKYLFKTVTDKTLLFAIKLTRREKETIIFEPMDPNDYWVECLAIAISLFTSFDSKPLVALDLALKLKMSVFDAKKLVISFLCDFIGASYGIDYLDQNWKFFSNYEDILYLSKKMLT